MDFWGGGGSCALVWGTQKFQNKYKSLIHACYFLRNTTRNQDASLLLCLVFQNAHGTWGKRNEFSCFMLGSQHKNLHHLSSFCAPSTEKQWHLDFRFCICQTNSLWHYPLYSNWMMNLAHHWDSTASWRILRPTYTCQKTCEESI